MRSVSKLRGAYGVGVGKGLWEFDMSTRTLQLALDRRDATLLWRKLEGDPPPVGRCRSIAYESTSNSHRRRGKP